MVAINQEVFRAGIYCRLSLDDGNVGDSSSIQTQKYMLEKYCKDNGFIITEIYIDDGYSGTNFNRPDFIRMIDDIEDGRINLVITKDLSRLGRDYIMTGHYMEIFFPSNNIRYIALNDGIDTSKDNNDIAPFKNILNDMYSKDLSRKVKSAKRQRMLQGMFISSQTPFGYIKDPSNPNRLVIDNNVLDTIKLIYQLALSGLGPVAIAKELTIKEVINPGAYKYQQGDTRFKRFYKFDDNYQYKWTYVTVRKILSDIVYLGDMENGKYHIPNYKTKKRVKNPVEKHIIVQNTHQAIISREDFDRVQFLINSRNRPTRHLQENIFKRILFCSGCGNRINLIKKKHRSGNHTMLLLCGKHASKPELCTQLNFINYDNLKEVVTKEIKKFFEVVKKDENELIRIIQSKLSNNPELNSYLKEKSKIEIRLNELSILIKKLYENHILGKLSEINYLTFAKEYQEEQDKLTKRVYELNKLTEKRDDLKNNFIKLKAMVNKFLNFNELTSEMVSKLIERIDLGYRNEVDGKVSQQIQITYRFINCKI